MGLNNYQNQKQTINKINQGELKKKKKMLQKARNNPDFALLQSKYAVDRFHNPYLSKFTFKLNPATVNTQRTSRLISPFDPTNHLYISQSLPIYKSQKFRASLVWKQLVKKKYARGFIGLSTEYRAENMWSLRSRAMFGSLFLYNLQAIKKIDNDTEVIFYHHGMYDNNIVAPIFGIGGRKKEISATLHRRFGLDYNAVFQYTKALSKGFYVGVRSEAVIGQNFESQSLTSSNTLSLDYYFDNSVRIRAGVTHHIEDNELRPVVEVEKSSEGWGNFLFSMEYRNNFSVLSFGYKNPTLNLILPVLFVDSPFPVIVSTAIYLLGYLFRKKTQPVVEMKKKEEDIRWNQLKLISDKANSNYEKERLSGERGLLIEEAYVGPAQLLDQLQATQNRGGALLRNNQMKDNVFDITMCFRFYVIKGELRIKKGDKNHLLGFYCNNSDDQILITYKKANQTKQIRLKMIDEIFIK